MNDVLHDGSKPGHCVGEDRLHSVDMTYLAVYILDKFDL